MKPIDEITEALRELNLALAIFVLVFGLLPGVLIGVVLVYLLS